MAYDGDLKRLADFVEDVPDVEVLSLGNSLEIVKDLGDAETVAGGYHLERLQRHPRDRPRPHGDRVRRRHLGRAPVLGVSVLRRRRRPQRPADELLPVEAAPRALRPPLPVRVRLGDHRRLPRGEDERGRDARGGDAREPRGARRRLHLHLRHEGRARRGEGRDGREAARALRSRRPASRSRRRRSRSARSSTTRSTPTTRTKGRCWCGSARRARDQLRRARPRRAGRGRRRRSPRSTAPRPSSTRTT